MARDDIRLVLTVPHAKCTYDRDNVCDVSRDRGAMRCDMLAQCFAERLGGALDNKIIHTIVASHQNRYDRDDNRFAPCEPAIKDCPTHLWVELKRTIQKYSDEVTLDRILVLDIHSFPDKSFDDNEVALLDNYPYQPTTQRLDDCIARNGFATKIYSASTGHNAIIDALTISPSSICAVLVEVNESMRPHRLDTLARVFVDFLLHWQPDGSPFIADRITDRITDRIADQTADQTADHKTIYKGMGGARELYLATKRAYMDMI